MFRQFQYIAIWRSRSLTDHWTVSKQTQKWCCSVVHITWHSEFIVSTVKLKYLSALIWTIFGIAVRTQHDPAIWRNVLMLTWWHFAMTRWVTSSSCNAEKARDASYYLEMFCQRKASLHVTNICTLQMCMLCSLHFTLNFLLIFWITLNGHLESQGLCMHFSHAWFLFKVSYGLLRKSELWELLWQ